MLRVGEVLSEKYRLERLLGSGGFATVWAARNLLIDRPVALKVLAENFAQRPAFVARFLREAKIASKPIHETIVRVEDVAVTRDGVPFLVMELLEGRTLSDELRMRGALPQAECLELSLLLLQGLGAAHAKGIVHRDIKPPNLFLTTHGSPGPKLRILDLGLAKDLDADDQLSRSGETMGTPDFLAPEQLLLGMPATAAQSSDVFAAGVVLFEMLTGHRPLDGVLGRLATTSALIQRAVYYQQNVPLPRPSTYLPVPAAIEAVIAHALEINPAKRYPDANEMLLALEAALQSLSRTLTLRDITIEEQTLELRADSPDEPTRIFEETEVMAAPSALEEALTTPAAHPAEDLDEELDEALTEPLQPTPEQPLPVVRQRPTDGETEVPDSSPLLLPARWKRSAALAGVLVGATAFLAALVALAWLELGGGPELPPPGQRAGGPEQSGAASGPDLTGAISPVERGLAAPSAASPPDGGASAEASADALPPRSPDSGEAGVEPEALEPGLGAQGTTRPRLLRPRKSRAARSEPIPFEEIGSEGPGGKGRRAP